MKYLFLLATVILALAACLAGCSSKSNNEAENEGIEEVSDGDLEENLDEPEEAEPEEIAEEEAEDEEISNEILDEELIEYEEEINEEELPNEAIAETEEEIGEEAIETEQSEPAHIKIQKLPWDGVQVVPCGENGDSVKQSRAVWGDGAGTVYFGGPEFWVFTEIGDAGTLACDSRVKGVFCMDGRVANGSTEIWVGLTSQIARLRGGLWTVYDIPAEVATGDVIDIDIAGDFVSVLTADSLALYDVTNDSWRKVTGCPDDLNRMYGLAYDGQTLWASAGMTLYKVNPTNSNCESFLMVEGDHMPYESIGLLNSTDGAIWLAYNSWTYTEMLGKALAVFSLKEEKITKYQLAIYAPCYGNETEYCIQDNLLNFTFIGSGMGGSPFIQMSLRGLLGNNPSCPELFKTFYHIYMTFQTIKPNQELEAISNEDELEAACSNTNVLDSMLINFYKQIIKIKSWRDGNVLWHLYGGPTKYSY